MVLIVFGLFALIAAALLGLPGRRRASATASRVAAATGRLRSFDFSFDLTEPVHVLVGHDRGAVPVLFVLRDRPEPGAALPHRAIRRRGPAVAADERVLEDPAAGAGAAARRSRLRVLHVQQAAAALQHRAADAAAQTGPPRPSTRARRQSSTPRSPRGARPPAALRPHATAATRHASQRRSRRFVERDAALQAVRSERDDAGAARPPATGPSRDVNYIIPTFILTQLPIGLDRHADRGHPDGGDRYHRRRAQLAGDRNGDRFLQAPGSAAAPPTRTTCAVSQDRQPASGDCSPAWSRCGRRSSAR